MRVVADRVALLDALKLCSRVKPSHSLPTLRSVLLRATQDGFVVASTDMTQYVEVIVPAKVDEPGGAVLARDYLMHFLSCSDRLEVSLRIIEGKLVVSGEFTAKLHIYPPQDYPPKPRIEGGTVLELTEEQVKSLKRRVLPFVAQDETRPVLTGIRLERDEGKLTATAADGFVLASLTLGEGGTPFGVTIPSAPLRILPDAPAKITITPVNVLLEAGQARVYSQLIEGTYPNWRALLEQYKPTSGHAVVAVGQENLRQFLKTVSVKGVTSVSLYLESGGVQYWASGPSEEDLTIEGLLPAIVKGANGHRVALSIVNLQKIYSTVDESIEFYVATPRSPVVFQVPGYSILAMPMLVHWEGRREGASTTGASSAWPGTSPSEAVGDVGDAEEDNAPEPDAE